MSSSAPLSTVAPSCPAWMLSSLVASFPLRQHCTEEGGREGGRKGGREGGRGGLKEGGREGGREGEGRYM